MMNAKYLELSLESIMAHLANEKVKAKEKRKHLRKKAKLLHKLEYKTGLDLCPSQWDFSSPTAVCKVKQYQMHAIKKVVGEVEDDGADIAFDYDTTNELIVQVKPINTPYDIFRFQYRRQHSSLDKCKVETIVIKASTYNRLTCPKDEN